MSAQKMVEVGGASLGVIIRGYERYDVTDWLGEIGVPTLALHGRHDTNIPARWGELLHERIAGSELVVFEGERALPLPRGTGEVP